jgi:hypothetical protein
MQRLRDTSRRTWLALLAWAGAALAILLLALQLVPYGRQHTAPPMQAEPAWNSPQTRMLAVRACFDCHSNQTRWRWYTNIAPISWLTQSDVDGGRQKLNFSEWGPSQPWAGQAAEVTRNGKMPPWYYLPLHPEAQLSPAERQALVKGLSATFGEGPRPPRR